MALNVPTEGIARECAKHPWRTIIAWVIMFAVGAVLALSLLQGNLTTNIQLTNNAESKRADDILRTRFPEAAGQRELIIVRSQEYTVDDAEFAKRLDEIRQSLEDLRSAGKIEKVDYYDLSLRTLPIMAASLDLLAADLAKLSQADSLTFDDLLQMSADLSSTAENLRDTADGPRYLDSDSAKEIRNQALQLADGDEQAAGQILQAAGTVELAPALSQLADALRQLSSVADQLPAGGPITPDQLRQTSYGLSDTAKQLREAAGTLRETGLGLAQEMADRLETTADGHEETAAQILQAVEALQIAPALVQLADSLRELSAAIGQLTESPPPTPQSLRDSAVVLRENAEALRDTANRLRETDSRTAQDLAIQLLQASFGQQDAADQLDQAADALELGSAVGQLGNGLALTSELAHTQIEALERTKPPMWELRVALLRSAAAMAAGFSAAADSGGAQIDDELAKARPEIEKGMQVALEGAVEVEDGVLQIKQGFAGRRSEIDAGIAQAEDGLAQIQQGFAEGKPQIEAKVKEAQEGAAQVRAGAAEAESLLVSSDRHATLMNITMVGSLTDAANTVTTLREVVLVPKDQQDSEGFDEEGFQVYLTGGGSVARDFFDIAEKDLKKADAVGLPIALVILAIVFTAVVAAVIPVILGLVAIVVALGFTALIGQKMDLNFSITNIVFMAGLAIGIDYCLFIVSRYREERSKGHEVRESIGRAGSTASRAVLFSGMTVVLSLMGMLLVPSTVHRSLGLGAILVVIVAVAAAMTLLPAILSLLGDRIDRLRVPLVKRPSDKSRSDGKGGFWDWMTRRVMGHPVVFTLLAAGFLVLCMTPDFGMRLGQSYVETLPAGTESKKGLDVLSEEFTPSLLAPVQIVIDGYDRQEVRDQTQALQQQLAADGDFRVVQIEVNQDGDVALMTVLLTGDPFASAATDSIYKLRHQYIGESFGRMHAQALVTGFTAFNSDFFKITREYTGIVFSFVLGLSFLLLMVVFRSVVIPLTSIIMNLLSVGAAYGLIVLVFQHGIGARFFGFQQIDSIDAWIPLFLFCILFGLSMDYYVFLLSRIREHYDKTGDNTESVAFGIRTTAGLITGAALIMLTVFIAFSRGQVAILQEMGFGLAMAVVMDATIVRVILVPSVMRLLGRRNWYFPRWLRWIPDVRVEPPGEEQQTAVDAGKKQPDWDFVEM